MTVPDWILTTACARGVTPEMLLGKERTKTVTIVRNAVMYWLRDRYKWSWQEIGRAFHRNHCTVIRGCERVQWTPDPEEREIFATILERLDEEAKRDE